MFRFIIVFAFVLFAAVVPVKAQYINIHKLDSLNNLTMNQFDTYITTQGYKFFKSTDSKKYGEAILYAFNQNDSNLKSGYFIKKYYPAKTGGQKIISFQTTLVAEYLSLKKELAMEHFVESQTDMGTSPVLSTMYKKTGSKSTAILTSYLSTEKEKVTIYEIILIGN